MSKKLRVAKKETSGKKILKVCLSSRDQAVDDYKNVCMYGEINFKHRSGCPQRSCS